MCSLILYEFIPFLLECWLLHLKKIHVRLIYVIENLALFYDLKIYFPSYYLFFAMPWLKLRALHKLENAFITELHVFRLHIASYCSNSAILIFLTNENYY